MGTASAAASSTGERAGLPPDGGLGIGGVVSASAGWRGSSEVVRARTAGSCYYEWLYLAADQFHVLIRSPVKPDASEEMGEILLLGLWHVCVGEELIAGSLQHQDECVLVLHALH